MSGRARLFPNPFFAATGYCDAFIRRRSKNVPCPFSSRFATYAFQYVTVPHPPVQVWRLTPAIPYAGGISVAAGFPSGRNALPSRFSSASNLPGPQLARTFLVVASSTLSNLLIAGSPGPSDTIAPTLRSRFGQPSRRFPIPGAKESSTVEWQTAHESPIERRLPSALKFPFTPTT